MHPSANEQTVGFGLSVRFPDNGGLGFECKGAVRQDVSKSNDLLGAQFIYAF